MASSQTHPLLLSHHLSDPHLPEIQSQPLPRNLHRTRTAPAISIPPSLLPPIPRPNISTSASILKRASAILLAYLCLGVLVYSTNPQGFSGGKTHPAVDALYFCINTLCTIGYADITPITPATKFFACVFVLIVFGFIDVLLSGAVTYVLDVQENILLASYIFDTEKGRMRIRVKVGFAVGVVVLCIGSGAVALVFLEGLDWVDAVYSAVMLVTTIGCGDRGFRTLAGRMFASLWLLVSTFAVARAFLFLAEARIDKRHREIVKLVLHRELTVDDFLSADLNRTGFMSKSEFIVYKLKEMGKVGENDILLICNQFNKLDRNNNGKITLQDLINRR